MVIKMFNSLIIITQLFFSIIAGVYFFTQLKSQRSDRDGINEDSKRILERLNEMRRISLTKPLTEQTRPKTIDEIIGQEDGVEALKTALCGKNPQHVLIYGPPGVGKTAASRVAMEYAKKSDGTPFKKDSKFIEVDATVMQYDERSIADPLIGSVHDPIYQGAGAYGAAGVPQPKEGAVSKAHGGILFIDEIGELQPIQINRLLKVLEDRRVLFESAYYSSTNKNIPPHIHDVFKNGIPADFRLIGATTRSPEEIPPAIRSRCTEIFFNPLKRGDIMKIIENTLQKLDITVDSECRDMICRYTANGRDAVSFLQTLSSRLKLKNRSAATLCDIEWIIDSGRYSPVYDFKVEDGERIGKVNALAVTGGGSGIVIPIEALCERGGGSVHCGGITETETIKNGSQSFTRTSTAKTSTENVITVLKTLYNTDTSLYDIYINIPGGMPIDGPSAGTAIFMCVYSAVNNFPISGKTAFTGELSILGEVLPVGGVRAKIEAAQAAGADTVFIPAANNCEHYSQMKIKVVPVHRADEIITYLSNHGTVKENALRIAAPVQNQ